MNILIDGQTLETPELNRGIGSYFKNVLNNMLKQRYEHNWYILVSSEKALNALDPWVKNRLIPFADRIFAPGTDYEREEAFTDRIEEIIQSFEIDAFWIPNPLMINVLFLSRNVSCKIFATVYDFIPMAMPDNGWPDGIRREYQRRLNFIEKNNVIPLFISEATRKDCQKYISGKINGEVTLLAADSEKFYNKNIYPKENYILYTGGFDYRKNISGAIEAFISLLEDHPDDELVKDAVMYVVCQYNEPDKLKMMNKFRSANIENRVIFTGYISDEALANLYAKAKVFFYPSLYEGFGLPVLEAMLSGDYILCSDNSSLPEICGNHALLCNPNDINDMSNKLYIALHEADSETDIERNKRIDYALTYSWNKTASKTLEIFENYCSSHSSGSKETIALVTPWPNQPTGIANYTFKIIPYISQYFSVDIFVDNTIDKKSKLIEYRYGKIFEIDQLNDRYYLYDHIIYELGNNSQFHAGTLEMFLKHPGIVEIHDYVLNHFIYDSFGKGKKGEIIKFLLEAGFGEDGINYYETEIKAGRISTDQYPLVQSICKLAEKTIVHNHWTANQMNGIHDINVIPHPAFEREEINEYDRKSMLKRISKNNDTIIIGCFGFMNNNKRPLTVISAVENLLNENYNVKLVFFGEYPDNGDAQRTIKEKKLEEKVLITGYLDRKEYESGLDAADIVVNLRFPTMGESSGTLCEALKYGKPVIVSDVGQYQEFPDEVCWKVPINQHEVSILSAMLKYLIDHEDIRKTLGENAALYANSVLAPARIAKLYCETMKVEN